MFIRDTNVSASNNSPGGYSWLAALCVARLMALSLASQQDSPSNLKKRESR